MLGWAVMLLHTYVLPFILYAIKDLAHMLHSGLLICTAPDAPQSASGTPYKSSSYAV